MPCPNCGAPEEHVVVDSVTFCRKCGPSVWAKREKSARANEQVSVVTVGTKGPRTRNGN